jgi:Cft2 family RNA processing exonuclease
VFHWDNGLKLTTSGLAIDFRRRQPRAFISHAHADHMARHEYALCTPETAALYQLRLGKRPTMPLDYRVPFEFAGVQLTTFPAGHCLGSAMLLANDGKQTLLYTGDFKLGPSATAQAAELQQADILVIESTFGHPNYRLPPREEVLGEFFAVVRQTLADGAVPVIHAYTLGKSQEVTKLLTGQGIPVFQHRDVYAVSRVYESLGCSLGQFELYDMELYRGKIEPGWAVVFPPGAYLETRLPQVRISLTGWAMDRSAKYRLRVDHAFPISDHADYDELIAAIDQIQAKIVYCTHGPESFVDRLLELGYNARVLGKATQRRLF